MPLDYKAVAFFYENGAYATMPGETIEQGKMHAALDLARAEREAKRRGWEVTWVPDDLQVNHVKEYGADAEPDTHEVAILRDQKGNLLATLGCVDDATDDYRRVVAAELAQEALSPWPEQN